MATRNRHKLTGRRLLTGPSSVGGIAFGSADKSVRATQAVKFLANKYEYRRRLPHYQKVGRTLFVTFRTLGRGTLSPEARDVVMRHCLHDHGKRYILHAAVIMPEHVHTLFTPLCDEHGWPYPLASILKVIKGTSARNINTLLGRSGPVWQEESFDHVLRSDESFEEKLEYIRQNPVRRGLVSRPEEYRWLWVETPEVPTGSSGRDSLCADKSVRATQANGKGHADFSTWPLFMPATTYSPTHFRAQYNRPGGA